MILYLIVRQLLLRMLNYFHHHHRQYHRRLHSMHLFIKYVEYALSR